MWPVVVSFVLNVLHCSAGSNNNMVTSLTGTVVLKGLQHRQFTDSLEFQSTARSAAECAIRCSDFDRCLTFTFIALSNTCRGHWNMMTSESPNLVSYGAETWALSELHFSIECSSRNHQPNECAASITQLKAVEHVFQISASPCTGGVTYGITANKDGVYVTDGCHATFTVTALLQPDNQEAKFIIDCASWNHHPTQCKPAIGTLLSVEVEKKYSSSACTLGHSFGMTSDAATVYVNYGCRAKFRVRAGIIV